MQASLERSLGAGANELAPEDVLEYLRLSLERTGLTSLSEQILADPKLAAIFDGYARSADFIQTYIFPGGMLLSPGQIQEKALAAGLAIDGKFYFTNNIIFRELNVLQISEGEAIKLN